MERLNKEYDKLQNKFGSRNLNSVYGYGQREKPRVVLVFMNPTKRNIATDKSWTGLRAQWLGTKQIWNFLTKCNLFGADINEEIQKRKPNEWTREFCENVYKEVARNGVWITNLAKCSQEDARPLPDSVFLEYKELLKEELLLLNPDKVLFFGNQVSSIMLDMPISVSTTRQKKFKLCIKNKEFDCYAIYYPVGNGRFNQDKAIEDIKSILK